MKKNVVIGLIVGAVVIGGIIVYVKRKQTEEDVIIDNVEPSTTDGAKASDNLNKAIETGKVLVDTANKINNIVSDNTMAKPVNSNFNGELY